MKFEVGEIAIIIGSCYKELIGEECEIIEVGAKSNYDVPNDYRIDIPSFRKQLPEGSSGWVIMEQYLKKKPKDQLLGNWHAVDVITGWNPTKEVVDA